jgi:hypothetical protein
VQATKHVWLCLGDELRGPPPTTPSSSHVLHVFQGAVPLHLVLAESGASALIESVANGGGDKLESSRIAGKV